MDDSLQLNNKRHLKYIAPFINEKSGRTSKARPFSDDDASESADSFKQIPLFPGTQRKWTSDKLSWTLVEHIFSRCEQLLQVKWAQTESTSATTITLDLCGSNFRVSRIIARNSGRNIGV